MSSAQAPEGAAPADVAGDPVRSPVRLLLIEEKEDDVRAVREALDAGRLAEFRVVRVPSFADAKRRLVNETFDLILVGSLPAEPAALEPLRALGSQVAGTPMILLADPSAAGLAQQAVHKGIARDYLVKGHLPPPLLEQAVLYAILRHRMMEGLRQARRQDSAALGLDRLTRLPNRAEFHDRLADALGAARQNGQMVAVLLLHLEGFKLVHDTLGAATGDPLLQQIATRLFETLRVFMRAGDMTARLSGDEFAVVLGDVPQMADVSRAADAILEAFSQPFVLGGLEFFISTTIGISLFPFDGADGESMLHNADIALRRSKEQGSDTYQFYLPAVDDRYLNRLELQNSLRIALARDEFLVYYMPQFDVRTGRIVSMEALARWKHPALGMIQPGDFIPLAEETGLILPLGERVLRAACARSRAWQDAGLPPIRVSVNFSARQFQHQNPVALVTRVLHETGLAPRHLELEITESAVMKDPESALGTLRALKETGIHLAIDDFGTGYSSLAYLRSFPIDALKVDRSFVRDLTTRPEDEAIVTAVIAMAHGLKLKVIAEGVETERHLEWLHAKGCDEVQGYHFSRPLPAEAAGALLARSR